MEPSHPLPAMPGGACGGGGRRRARVRNRGPGGGYLGAQGRAAPARRPRRLPSGAPCGRRGAQPAPRRRRRSPRHLRVAGSQRSPAERKGGGSAPAGVPAPRRPNQGLHRGGDAEQPRAGLGLSRGGGAVTGEVGNKSIDLTASV